MSTQPLADVVKAVRAEVGDTGTGRAQAIRVEGTAGDQDGTNKLFTVQWYPIVTGTFVLRKNGTILTTPAQYAVNLVNGLITIAVAEAAPVFGDRLEAEYSHLWYADNEYHEFIFSAAQKAAGVTAKGVSVEDRATNAIKDIQDGLMDSLRLYAACQYNYRRADESAHEFSSAAGGQNVTVDVRTKNFLELAKSLCDRADVKRDDFHKRRGGREAPSSAITNYAPVLRYQPRR